MIACTGAGLGELLDELPAAASRVLRRLTLCFQLVLRPLLGLAQLRCLALGGLEEGTLLPQLGAGGFDGLVGGTSPATLLVEGVLAGGDGCQSLPDALPLVLDRGLGALRC